MCRIRTLSQVNGNIVKWNNIYSERLKKFMCKRVKPFTELNIKDIDIITSFTSNY